MSDVKHIPGPWFYEDHEGDSVHYWITAAKGTGQRTNGEYLSVSGIMNEATAALIAAAPRLLEVLEDLITADEGAEDWIAVRAAIAQARGNNSHE